MKSKIYYAIMRQLKRGGHGCISAGNTLIDHSQVSNDRFAQKSLCSAAAILTNSGKLILDFPRMDASLIHGDIGRIAYFGPDDAVKLSLLESLFPLGFEEVQHDRLELWKLPDHVRTCLPVVDLAVCRVGHWFPWQLSAPVTFETPIRIHQVVPLASSIDEILRGRSIRKRLNRYLRQNHHGWLTTQQHDFDYFYSRMYLPAARRRFGAKIHVQSYDALFSWFQRGMLLMVAFDGTAVSGSLIYQQGSTWFDGFSGFLDGDPELLHRGASAVLYWYSLKLAIEHGASQANFIDSNAWSSDGVFQHKRSWGAIVQEDPYVIEKIVFLAKPLSHNWQERLNDIGFIAQTKQGFLRVYYEAATRQDGDQGDKVAKAMQMGLHGVRLISPSGRVDLYGDAVGGNGQRTSRTHPDTVTP